MAKGTQARCRGWRVAVAAFFEDYLILVLLVSPACGAVLSAGLLLPTTRAAVGYYERTKTVITEMWQDRSPGAQTGLYRTRIVISSS